MSYSLVCLPEGKPGWWFHMRVGSVSLLGVQRAEQDECVHARGDGTVAYDTCAFSADSTRAAVLAGAVWASGGAFCRLGGDSLSFEPETMIRGAPALEIAKTAFPSVIDAARAAGRSAAELEDALVVVVGKGRVDVDERAFLPFSASGGRMAEMLARPYAEPAPWTPHFAEGSDAASSAGAGSSCAGCSSRGGGGGGGDDGAGAWMPTRRPRLAE